MNTDGADETLPTAAAETTAVVRVPAVRGAMGNTTYYLATVPMGAAVKLFAHDRSEDSLPSEERHQRKLNPRRIPEISEYITQHPDYIFGSVVVSIGEYEGDLYDEETDELMLPLDAVYRVNDGQHRIAGIEEALKHEPDLRHDTLAVMVLPDEELERSQQVFSDLNRTVQKTSRTLDILYDRRTPLNRITAAVVEQVPLFQGRTDHEHANVSSRSQSFTTLAAVQAANADLLGNIPSGDDTLEKQAEELAVHFWTFITPYVKPWEDISKGDLSPQDAREKFLSSYTIALRAIASVGKQFLSGENQKALMAFQSINWKKDNPEWAKLGVIQDGQVLSRGPARKALEDALAQKLLFAPASATKRRRTA
jgi:DNA sulfur modification protein DndB